MCAYVHAHGCAFMCVYIFPRSCRLLYLHNCFLNQPKHSSATKLDTGHDIVAAFKGKVIKRKIRTYPKPSSAWWGCKYPWQPKKEHRFWCVLLTASDVLFSIPQGRDVQLGSGHNLPVLHEAVSNECRKRANNHKRWDQVTVKDIVWKSPTRTF